VISFAKTVSTEVEKSVRVLSVRAPETTKGDISAVSATYRGELKAPERRGIDLTGIVNIAREFVIKINHVKSQIYAN
jgi:hypothetical protein